jgi:leucyl-tRNA synthetase
MSQFLILLQPFAPHIAEELWSKMRPFNAGASETLAYAAWPKWNADYLVENTLNIPVQVNGKLRDVLTVDTNIPQPDLEKAALASEKVKAFINGRTVKKIIVVPKKLVNIVVA